MGVSTPQNETIPFIVRSDKFHGNCNSHFFSNLQWSYYLDYFPFIEDFGDAQGTRRRAFLMNCQIILTPE